MAEFPALPLWTDAWIADTNHLTRAERGMYHDLLVLMWRTPSCSVPNDMEWLTKHLRLSLDEIVALKSLIKEFCHFDANGMEVAYAREMPVASERLYQKRLSKEWAYLKEQSKRQSQNAKSRWKKEKIVCQTDANGMEVAYAPTPTPTPTPFASTAIPSPDLSIAVNSKVNFGSGNGVAKANGYHSQVARDQKGAAMVVELMGKNGVADAWAIAMSAEDTKDPSHEKSCRIMRKWAKEGGIGWVSPERRKPG